MTNSRADRQNELLSVGKTSIGPNCPTFFVAEEGQANDGNLETAFKMVAIAAAAGADAIEFQLARADDFYVRNHPNHAVYARREFDRGQLEELLACTREAGIVAVVTPLSSKLTLVLADLGCSIFNVNSSDLDNPELLDAVADSGRPFFVSSAMASSEEVDWAVERLHLRGADNFVLLHGQHVMATGDGRGVPEEMTNLAAMNGMRRRYGLHVGFIDHTSSIVVPAIAAARGASVVSKHFTWDRSARGPDWHICLEPDELAEAIRLVRLADRTRGDEAKAPVDGEEADRSAMRRSIVAAAALPAGTVLTTEHLAFKRPGGGLSPRCADELLGRRLKVPLEVDHLLQMEHLE